MKNLCEGCAFFKKAGSEKEKFTVDVQNNGDPSKMTIFVNDICLAGHYFIMRENISVITDCEEFRPKVIADKLGNIIKDTGPEVLIKKDGELKNMPGIPKPRKRKNHDQ